MARYCYHSDESFFNRSLQGYQVVKITENEAGFIGSPLFRRQLADAVNKSEELNRELGLTPEDVQAIRMSSMRESIKEN